MYLDEHEDNSSNDGVTGLKGIRTKVLDGTTILGFSRGYSSLKLDTSYSDIMDANLKHCSRTLFISVL